MQATIPFHLQCDPKKIARYVLLPGDPGRVPKIAAYLEQAALVSQNREFTIYSGLLDGVPVSVASTGIGGASAAIAMEELVQCGADTFLRVGTCGGMQPELIPGTLILPNFERIYADCFSSRSGFFAVAASGSCCGGFAVHLSNRRGAV